MSARGLTVPSMRRDRDAAESRLDRSRIEGSRLRGLEEPERSVPAAPVANVFTVDLEDWPVAVMGPSEPITGRVVENTLKLLNILHWHGVHATFFVLTRVAEAFPELIAQVREAGHEIASHGHGHQLLTRQTPAEFEADVRRSVDVLQELTGERPMGYRAPAFSVVRETRWAGPILSRLGFQYSSSVFPILHRRYGIASAPRGIHRWDECPLMECPPATVRVAGVNLPIAGGGYFRLLPGAVVRAAVRRLNHAGQPAILYVHPYELDVDGLTYHADHGVRIGTWRRMTQSLGRESIEERLHRLLESFSFTTMRALLAPNASIPASQHAAAGAQ